MTEPLIKVHHDDRGDAGRKVEPGSIGEALEAE